MREALPALPASCFGNEIECREVANTPANVRTFVRGHGARRGSRLQSTVGLGWQPDLPDHRDWDLPKIIDETTRDVAKKAVSAGEDLVELNLRYEPVSPKELPSAVDLRASGWLSKVEDQQHIGSCTAHAVIGAIESLNNRLERDPMNLSRLFLYKATRKLLGWQGDSGAYIRRCIQALRLFGVPPEEHWAYDPDRFDDEPDAFHYAYAANYKATRFARLDRPELTGQEKLSQLKLALTDGHAIPLGFTLFDSVESPGFAGEIPFPGKKARQLGGHAVLAVGFDDSLTFSDSGEPGPGGLIVQNSWGTEWGDKGYGYLPYAYVQRGLAVDFWIIVNTDWVGERLFS